MHCLAGRTPTVHIAVGFGVRFCCNPRRPWARLAVDMRPGGMRERLWRATEATSRAALAVHPAMQCMGPQPPCVCPLTVYKQKSWSTLSV